MSWTAEERGRGQFWSERIDFECHRKGAADLRAEETALLRRLPKENLRAIQVKRNAFKGLETPTSFWEKYMKLQACLLLAAAVVCAPSLQAQNYVGGDTTVALNSSTYSTLSGLFDIGVIPPATISGLDVSFPIIGQTSTTISHSGGLSFDGTTTPMGVGTTTDIEDFVINLSNDTISGTVVVNGGSPMTGVTFFDLNNNLGLTLDSTLASDLSSIYGVPDLSGASIGTATITPAATPEPSSLSLLGLAVAGMGAGIKRRWFAKR